MASLTPDGLAAAQALLAVVRAPNVGDADERFLEALILNALQQIPALPHRLLSCGHHVEFAPGSRGLADIVGRRNGEVVVQVEVKIRAQINNWDVPDKNQLNLYASKARQAQLTLITTEEHYIRRKTQFEATSSIQAGLWTLLLVPDLKRKLARLAGSMPADGSAERLALSLARLI